MSRARTEAAVLVAVLATLVAASAWGAPVPSLGSGGKGKEGSVLVMKPGKLTGTVVYSDGRSRVAKAPVRVWSVDHQKFVHQGVADAQGAYEVPELAEGRYVAIFGDRVRVELVVDQRQGVTAGPLKVIIPRGKTGATPKQLARELMRVGAVHQEGAGEPKKRSLLMTSLIAIGGATAAVGAYELFDDDHSSSYPRPVVSP